MERKPIPCKPLAQYAEDPLGIKWPRSHWGKAPIRNFGRDYSPVPDLAKYECPESDDEYRHRMIINAIALVFTSLLILAGLWFANNMIPHA
jgi:hypothetical protein